MARRKLREVPRSVNLVKVKSRHSWRISDGSAHPVKVAKPKQPQQGYILKEALDKHNPPWTKDELILALDLYFRFSSFPSNENHPDIVALSKFLNRLPIHPKSRRQQDFRNPNGVYMKLCNFLRFDPTYHGKGLDAGSKLDEEVWNRFQGRRGELTEIAEIIRTNYTRITRPAPYTEDTKSLDEDEEFPEGRIIRRLHTVKERSIEASRKKKALVLKKTGKLECEVCNFDFAHYYGEEGYGFAECHHIRPLAELKGERRIRAEDLAIVCANCHRMLHRIRPWATVSQLRDRLIRMGHIKQNSPSPY
jgi:5-methylcytosine-specific restriction protein A